MPLASRLRRPLWWTAILALWLVSTWIDRSWLSADQSLPSWDQAEYLSSAIEHGRGLGLLEQGRWLGWAALLDLSPKIPPLSSLISGAVIAVAGDGPAQASWVLSLWHGVLLITVACWGRQLKGPSLGLLAALVVAIAPAMAEHRVEFSLDLPLAASTTLALWLLYRWQSQDPLGGRWHQAVMAAGAIAAGLLIKQSALLIVALPALWSGLQALREPRRRQQFFVGLVLVLLLLTPWLHHNWISTLGGTERAVLTSGAEEGDPGLNDLASLIWYPRLWPSQLGELLIAGGIAGALLSGWRERRGAHQRASAASSQASVGLGLVDRGRTVGVALHKPQSQQRRSIHRTRSSSVGSIDRPGLATTDRKNAPTLEPSPKMAPDLSLFWRSRSPQSSGALAGRDP